MSNHIGYILVEHGVDDGTWITGGSFSTLGILDNAGQFTAPGQIYNSFFRLTAFSDKVVPPGAIIVSAYLIMVSGVTYGAPPNVLLNIYFNDIDNAVAPTSVAEVNALDLTSPIAWNFTTQVSDGDTINSPELKTILQTVIDRPGYAAGNAIQVIIKDNSSVFPQTIGVYSVDSSSENDAVGIYIEWEGVDRWFPPPVALTEFVIDYGKKPYVSEVPYADFVGNITEQYVGSLGYSEPTIDYKKPYLYDDYHEMMYSFDTENMTSGGKMITPVVGSVPSKYDPVFSYAPQLASLNNFNAYANYNYRIMGKVFPLDRAETTSTAPMQDEYIIYESLKMDTSSSSPSQTLSVGNVRLKESDYKWTISGVGSLSADTGLSVVYTAPYRTNAFVTIRLVVGLDVRDSIKIKLFYPT
jgi:hypothetical protein